MSLSLQASESSQHLQTKTGITPRRPGLIAALLFGAGIAADRALSIPLTVWFCLAAGCLAGLILFCIWKRAVSVSTLCLFGLICCTGGLRHHSSWDISSPRDLTNECSEAPLTVAVRGRIIRTIEIQDRRVDARIPPWLEVDRSVGHLELESIQTGTGFVPCTGRVRLDVTGHLVGISVGDRVEVLGQMSRPGPPRNPGEVPFSQTLKRQGAHAMLRVSHPAAVRSLGRTQNLYWMLARGREEIRQECRRLMSAELPPPLSGLASSLLIGDRSRLTDELKDQFAETGMMHLIAISGINVGILLGMVYLIGRFLNVPFRQLAWVMIGIAFLFTWITDQQPSVVRAGLLAAMGLLAGLANRQGDRWNLLGSCALILLVWNPADLFDIGAQLSFLAVAAIFWSTGFPLRQFLTGTDPVPVERGHFGTGMVNQGWNFAQAYFVTCTIWLATVPLTIATFHLLPPIGLLMDLLLVPVATVVLAIGYLFLTVGLLSPWLGSWIAIPFHWGLFFVQNGIAWGREVPFGHLYVPAIPLWWLTVFYLLLAWNWLRVDKRPRLSPTASPGIQVNRSITRCGGVWLMLIWIVSGLLLPLIPKGEQPFRCTFLSVGHGLACVMELPNREAILYDVGTLGDGRRAQRAVERLLWERGVRVIDTLIVSHADHDHFSGMFGLLERFPVRQLLISTPTARSDQSGVLDLMSLASRQGVSLRIVEQSDELVSGDVRIAVLQPSADGILSPDSSRSDNEQSLVLRVDYAGRRVLLTGDLERQGLRDLLSRSDLQADLLLAPHHGGRDASLPALYQAVRPNWVVVSAGRGSVSPELAGNFPAELLNTATAGAILFEIHPDGLVRCQPFHQSLEHGLLPP